ncbi:MAG: preprotein translocase subunit YajC [Bacteroidales bacterium]
MNTILAVMLQAGSVTGGQGGAWGNIIFIVALVAIFYFFMIRPQSKRQKETRRFRESLKVGDKVISAGGIHGKIKEVKDDTVTLEIAENVRVKVEKASIYANSPEVAQELQK